MDQSSNRDQRKSEQSVEQDVNSQVTQNDSDLDKAIERLDTSKVDQNLNTDSLNASTEPHSKTDNDTHRPESLSNEEQTPFIDDTLRTDK